MTDLVKVLATLVNPDGKIQVPGVYEMVPTVSEEEEALYTKLDFAMSTFNDSIAGKNSILNDPTKTLQNRWRWPSLSIHGIHGAFSEPGFKVMPLRDPTQPYVLNKPLDCDSSQSDWQILYSHSCQYRSS